LSEPVPDPARLVPSIASSTRHLVMTLMAKEPNKRFSDYQGLINSCEAALRTLSMRDTSSIKLLRRPMVLSKPRMVPSSSTAATVTTDPFEHETGRLRRRVNAVGDGPAAVPTEYKPSTDKHPVAADSVMHDTTSRPTRPGSATEVIDRVATEKIKRKKTTGIHRKNTAQATKPSGTAKIDGNTTNPTVLASDALPIPTLPPRDLRLVNDEPAHDHHSHWVAWTMLALAIFGLILAAIFRPGA